MLVLDTDHLSLIEKKGAEARRIEARLSQHGDEVIATTIITYEEQTRGWLSYLSSSRSLEHQVSAYLRLKKHLFTYTRIPVIDFDEEAAEIYRRLVRSRLRVGSFDLKIAAIVLARRAILLSRNLSHFRRIPELQVEDWSS